MVKFISHLILFAHPSFYHYEGTCYNCLYVGKCLWFHQVLAILYDGGKAAQEEPRLLGTVENKVCSVPKHHL